MTAYPKMVGVKFYVKVSSPIMNSVDTPLLGLYEIHTPKGRSNQNDLAGKVLNYLHAYMNFQQPQLIILQIYDRNGHEIPTPNRVVSDDSYGPYVHIERVLSTQAPRIVDATRTPMDAMSSAFSL